MDFKRPAPRSIVSTQRAPYSCFLKILLDLDGVGWSDWTGAGREEDGGADEKKHLRLHGCTSALLSSDGQLWHCKGAALFF